MKYLIIILLFVSGCASIVRSEYDPKAGKWIPVEKISARGLGLKVKSDGDKWEADKGNVLEFPDIRLKAEN